MLPKALLTTSSLPGPGDELTWASEGLIMAWGTYGSIMSQIRGNTARIHSPKCRIITPDQPRLSQSLTPAVSW